MLVLTRRVGERIYIGDDIVVTLLDIDRNRVRLGIQAPKTTPVYREEVLNQIRAATNGTITEKEG